MAPETMGPRQITAASSLGRIRFMDMIGIPPFEAGGGSVCVPATTPGFSRTPNMRGIDGPVMSPSSTPTRRPRRFRPTASRPATRDFPTPPLPDITAMPCFTPFGWAIPLGPPLGAGGRSGSPSGSFPVSASSSSWRMSASTFTFAAVACPAAACAIVSALEMEHEAQPSPCAARTRAASGQRSTTEAIVMSGVMWGINSSVWPETVLLALYQQGPGVRVERISKPLDLDADETHQSEDGEEHPDADEHHDRVQDPLLLVRLRHEVRRSDVEDRARRDGEQVGGDLAEHRGGEDARERGHREQSRGAERPPPGRARGLHHGRDRESFRKLVKHDRGEDEHSEAPGRGERGTDRYPVHERVEAKPDEGGARHMGIDDRGPLRLLAEVEVRGEDVLEEVDEQVAGEDQGAGDGARLGDGLGNELEERDAEEVTRAAGAEQRG